ncbi:MAG: hypothetical protein JXR73_22100 [Candidatus Omnitrophica bacterium]|nr:hypothetical protein [Candidatus Omnitrophota bacterium]
MWLFTSQSFLSIVVDKNNPERRLVRARRRGDIEKLFPNAQVFEDPSADYRYRAFVSVEELIEMTTDYIRGMHYANFKNSIPAGENDYHNACFDVWSVMRKLQE